MKSKLLWLLPLTSVTLLLSGCPLPRDNSGNGSTEFYCTQDGDDPSISAVHGIRVSFPSCAPDSNTCSIGNDGITRYATILFVPGNNIGFNVTGRASMDDMQADMDAANAQGFAAATINYRRNGGMNGIADDIACAVRYLKQRPANTANQAIDANRVGVMSHSLASIGTWQLAAGIEPAETKQELNNPDHLDSQPILYSDRNTEQNSLPAAVVISNGSADPMSMLTGGVAHYNIDNGITQPDTKLPCNYNMAFILAYQYPVNPLRTCDINGLAPRFTGIKSYNAPYWMAHAPIDRKTRGNTARPVLIVNSRNDATMKPINSFITQSHFNQPQLRPLTNLVPLVQLDDDHPYTKFNPEFRKIFMRFFNAALANNGNPSSIDYCEGITQPAGNTSGYPACRLNPTN